MSSFRILCIRCDRIGDLLVSTPVLHRLRKLYPDAEIEVVTSPAGALALEGNQDIDRVHVYNKKSLSTWFSLLPVLLKPHDMVVGFNAASRTIRLLTSLARGHKKGFLQTGNLAPWSGEPEAATHISAKLLRELESEFDLPHDEHPDIRVRFHIPENVLTEVQKAYPRRPGTKRIAMFIGNIAQPKLRWPAEKFAQLAAILLRENTTLELYAVAGSADVPLLDAFANIKDDRFHSFVGKTSLQHTAAFIGTCDAFITSSSSPQHLAAAVGVPITSIVHPQSHLRWAPRGPQNFSAISNIDYDVRDIEVKLVYETLNTSMQGFLSPWQE